MGNGLFGSTPAFFLLVRGLIQIPFSEVGAQCGIWSPSFACRCVNTPSVYIFRHVHIVSIRALTDATESSNAQFWYVSGGVLPNEDQFTVRLPVRL